MRIPIGIGRLLADQSLLWAFHTEPEETMHGQRHYWPRGRLLGGSSSVNGMIFTRGGCHAYDRWRDAGCPGWGYQDVLPVLKRIEHRPEGDPDYRGRGGPIRVSDIRHDDALSKAFYASCRQIGIPAAQDYNGRDYEGVSPMQSSMRRGRRCSTAVAYLEPARRRPNLTVVTNALVDRLIIQEGQARSVVFTRSSAPEAPPQQINASREIILCAGALCSPQILERSGIGDRSRLQALGIAPLRDLPAVGENLQDHVNVRNSYQCTRPITVNDMLNNRFHGAKAATRYLFLRSGLMATPTVSTQALVKTRPQLDAPDIKLQLCHVSGADRLAMAKGLGVDKYSGFSLQAFQLHPASRGSIHIRSRSPQADPVIHANYLEKKQDQDAAVKGLELIRELADRSPLAKLIVREVRPGPGTSGYHALLDYARQCGQTCWHSVGTCKMGTDASAVVDPALKVHGIGGLRVADGSVMPLLVSSNTNAPSIMIGERCADFLLDQYSRTAPTGEQSK